MPKNFQGWRNYQPKDNDIRVATIGQQSCRSNPVVKSIYRPRLAIGIDPGIETGLAIWDRILQKFMMIKTFGIYQAMITVRHNNLLQSINQNDIIIRLEDARLRTWFDDAGPEKLQGAGSIKRDCSVWEEFIRYHGFPYELVPPKNNKTKWTSAAFIQATGWLEKTNEHARDAAMLVYKF
jgi:hypothetical protein